MKPTIPQPFNFLIDKIKESKPKIIETSKEFCFRARKVPSYKFFEPVLSEKPLQIPNEFKLSTEIRGHSKSK
jgi:hypothetical protein